MIDLILQHTLLSVLYTMVFKVLIQGKRLNHMNEAESITPYFSFLVGYCFDTRTFRFYLYTWFILSNARRTMPRLAQQVAGWWIRPRCGTTIWLQQSSHLWFVKTFWGYGANSGSANKWSSSSNNAESGSLDPYEPHPWPVSQCRSDSGGDPWESKHRIGAKQWYDACESMDDAHVDRTLEWS